MGQPAAALAIGTSSKTDASCWNFNWICNCWYCNWCSRNAKLLLEKNANTEVGTTASISNLPVGTYTVTVTDNCSSNLTR
jgi:hypothetical protein